ncbi:MAG: fimbrial protein [Rhodanobacteraceae bacterium]|nr:MAG: fimbrial protein [Rhodanobacteraceae bacterium]
MIDAAAASISNPPFPFMERGTTVRDMRMQHSITALRVVALLLGLLLVAVAGRARADCYYSSGTAATISFAPPATIAVSPDTAVGTVLWTSAPVAPANPLVLNCSGTNGSGIADSMGLAPVSGTLFPTGIPWLSYQVLYPDSSHILQSYPNELVTGGYGTAIAFSTGYALQLVVTGPVTNGGTLSGQLGVWQMIYFTCAQYNNGGNCPTPQWVAAMHPLATFLTSGVTFVLGTCKAAVDPTVVTLPAVYASAFSGAGTTTGQTPFNVQLTCSGRVNLAITLATSNPQAGAAGVIAPTSGPGYAQNVGVQLLDGSGNPASFGTAISAGQTANGPFNIPFSARYYQTGANASAGKVTATATYTLTYQ